jgi:hypothetical protein
MTKEEFNKLEPIDQLYIRQQYNSMIGICHNLRSHKAWPGKKSSISAKGKKDIEQLEKRLKKKLESFG